MCPNSLERMGPLGPVSAASSPQTFPKQNFRPPPFLFSWVPPQRLPKIKKDPLNNFMGPLPKIPSLVRKVLFWFFLIVSSICYLLPIVKILIK